MKGRLKDLLVGRGKKQILMIELDGDFRADFDNLSGADVEITIKKWFKKRSLDANAYCWVLIDRLARVLNLPKETVYRDAIRQIGGVSEVVCVVSAGAEKLKRSWQKHGIGWQVEEMPSKLPGCTNLCLYYGSSVYDTRQMSQLVDHIVRECEEQGIPTISDEELERLKSNWR